MFFQHIISNAAIDFTKDEMKDIQAAMKTMLERIRTRVNRRGIFNIASVVPAGSMCEQTSLWKFDVQTFDVLNDDDDRQYYIEFDFLAPLNNLTHQCTKQTAEIECKGCIKIVKPPVNLERVRQCYSDRQNEFNTNSLEDKRVISDLFLNEINYCLTTACNCLSFQCRKRLSQYLISLEHHKHGCGECTVDMPTGTLRVNTVTGIDQNSDGPNNCSLIFQWTSKAKSLSAPDKLLLQEPQPVSSLPIFVDFLPALESLTSSSSGARKELYYIVPKHYFFIVDRSKAKSLSAPDKRLLQEPQPVSQLPIFINFLPALESLTPSSSGARKELYYNVPKQCNDLYSSDYKYRWRKSSLTPSSSGARKELYYIVPKQCNVLYSYDYKYRWRKSWCIAELNAFTKEMSNRHRRCYQIIKYLLEINPYLKLPSYHIKTIILRHHTECTDTTDELVQCVVKIYQDLHQAYETGELLSYQSNLNLLKTFYSHSDEGEKCEMFINTLCSVSVTDTWETFSRKIQKL